MAEKISRPEALKSNCESLLSILDKRDGINCRKVNHFVGGLSYSVTTSISFFSCIFPSREALFLRDSTEVCGFKLRLMTALLLSY